MHQNSSIQFKLSAAMVLVTLVASATYATVLLNCRKHTVLQQADQKLLVATESARSILGSHYHDRIFDKASISREEFDRIVAAFDQLCLRTGMQYIWSVMVLNEQIVFTSATHSVLTNPDSDCATFLEVHTTPEVYQRALDTMQPDYSTFDNKWGQGRMLLIPALDKHGRKHLFAASVHLGQLSQVTHRTVIQSLLISAAITLGAILASLPLARALARPIINLTQAAERMARGDLGAELAAGGSREVIVLADSLETMRKAIRSQMEALGENRKSLAYAQEIAHVGNWTWSIVDDQITCSDEMLRIYGLDPKHFEGNRTSIDRQIHPDDVVRMRKSIDDLIAGQPFTPIEYRVLHPDGTHRVVEILHRQVYCDTNGQPVRMSGVVMDVTERRQTEQRLQESQNRFAALADHNQRLVKELEHRVRNHIAGLLGLISVMRTRTLTVDAFAAAIESRLMAMAHSQRLLAETQWGPVDLRKLVTSTLGTMAWMARHSNSVTVHGTEVQLPPDRAAPLTLILVEWFSNSCKYGAHSVPGGTLKIDWTVQDKEQGRMIRFSWIEQNGPAITQPVAPSLGTELIHGFVKRELHGRCHMTFARDGVEHLIEFPLSGQVEPGAEVTPPGQPFGDLPSPGYDAGQAEGVLSS